MKDRSSGLTKRPIYPMTAAAGVGAGAGTGTGTDGCASAAAGAVTGVGVGLGAVDLGNISRVNGIAVLYSSAVGPL